MVKPSTLQVCGVTCCGIINFEQHCTSKKHLRKAAGVAHATVSSDSLLALPQEGTSGSAPASDSANGTTYVGYQAQCRTYCKQVLAAMFLTEEKLNSFLISKNVSGIH